MNGERAKQLRKFSRVLHYEFPEETARRFYRKMKQERKKDRMYAN